LPGLFAFGFLFASLRLYLCYPLVERSSPK
jgi:hypothetical protein